MRAVHSLAITTALVLASGCASLSRDAATPPAAELLPAYNWVLQEATSRAGQRDEHLFAGDKAPLQLHFADNRLGVSQACNHISGDYSIRGGDLVPGTLVQTMMACEQPLMQREEAIKRYLQEPLKLAIDTQMVQPLLTLTTREGATLVWQGEPTPETRFGSNARVMYLEVQAQTPPCSHPLIPDQQCLQVREVEYDSDGLKTTTGDWSLLYQEIEGFSHEPGTRNILRVKHFEIPQPAADQSNVAYVLDIIVESVRVN